MDIINTLNETAVTFVSDLSWAGIEGPGYEAISWTGEIRAFTTYREANVWRLAEVRGQI